MQYVTKCVPHAKEYDSPDAIRKSLSSLEEFHALLELRHDAHYERGETLTDYIVRASYLLDRCGNCFLLDEIGMRVCVSTMLLEPLLALQSGFPEVVEPNHFTTQWSTLHFSGHMQQPPGPFDVCGECAAGWTVMTMHDAVPTPSDEFRHHRCHEIAQEREALTFYRELLVQAGLGNAVIRSARNEYNCDGARWIKARTPYGDIKIGWRKRVINIDWSDVVARRALMTLDQTIWNTLSAQAIFPNEDVTKGQNHIHAWGERKAVEYLETLAKALHLGSRYGEPD